MTPLVIAASQSFPLVKEQARAVLSASAASSAADWRPGASSRRPSTGARAVSSWRSRSASVSN